MQVQGQAGHDSTLFRGKVRSGALQRGGARLSAHQKRSPQQYLQTPKMYFDGHCDHSLPGVKVSSETASRTRWAPKAFEPDRRARSVRCSQLGSANDSAAQRCGAEDTSAQASVEVVNGRRMAILSRRLEREWGGVMGR